MNVAAAERAFELRITSLDLPFVGVIDPIADVDGKRTVVDFKTANAAYQEHEAILSDQLTSYQLAEPEAEQTAFCVLVKTKEPKSNGTWRSVQATIWPNFSSKPTALRTTSLPAASTSGPASGAPGA